MLIKNCLNFLIVTIVAKQIKIIARLLCSRAFALDVDKKLNIY